MSRPTRPVELDQLVRPMGRLGPWMAAIWLFFLVDPFRAGWHDRDHVSGVLGMIVTVAFGATYMFIWIRTRMMRHRMMIRPRLSEGLPLFVLLLVLGISMMLTVGSTGTAAVVYLAVCSQLVFALPWAIAVTVTMMGGAVVLGEVVPGWPSQTGLALSAGAAFLAIFGIMSMLRRNLDLIVAHKENAELAVENERNRFGRDLHDILGHSLTVITVKAELANRLLDLDPARARAELADLEQLSRDALADVRRAVEGYRELTLPGEIARARTALSAAQIDAVLPNSTDDVASDARELFAWAVREGITNVIRHSGARRCQVRLSRSAVEIVDDGHGPDGNTPGHGLAGLRERAAATGGTVVTRTLDPGFSLTVALPRG